jgi:hypothetical protein
MPQPRRRSPAQRRREERLEALEAWWAFFARVFTFFLGAAMMGWQVVFENADRLYLIAVAATMMGVIGANVLGSVLTGGRAEDSEEK